MSNGEEEECVTNTRGEDVRQMVRERVMLLTRRERIYVNW